MPTRRLVVLADDFGIGPETSRGILELGRKGHVTGTVLLVNSPHASEAVARWRAEGRPMELGWHPNLTLDHPLASNRRVPSLVSETGNFHTLTAFLTRYFLGRIRQADLETELRTQWRRFIELVGHPPTLVAAHQHITLFPPLDRILHTILKEGGAPVYLRNVVEPWSLWRRVPGARFKRLVLNLLGRRSMALAQAQGFHGAEHLLGITDHRSVQAADFFTRWLSAVPGNCAELMCHPGYRDETLRRRDLWFAERPQELELLRGEHFATICAEQGWTLTPPSRIVALRGCGQGAA